MSERPFWQTSDCPKWCIQTHRNSDHPDDRFHHSDTLDISLTLGPPFKNGDAHEPEGIQVWLYQDDREVEPHVCFGFNHAHLDWKLTLQEAERLAHRLGNLFQIGTAGEDFAEVFAEIAQEDES